MKKMEFLYKADDLADSLIKYSLRENKLENRLSNLKLQKLIFLSMLIF